MCSPNHFLLRENLQAGGSLPISSAVMVVGSMASLFQHFDMGIFSLTQCVGVTQLVSGFLSERIDLFSSEHSVYPWEEGNSGASYVAILVQSPFKSSLYI